MGLCELVPYFDGCPEEMSDFIGDMTDTSHWGELGVVVGGWIWSDLLRRWQVNRTGMKYRRVSDLHHAVMHKRLSGENPLYEAVEHLPLWEVWSEEMRLFAESSPYGRDSMASIMAIP